MIATYIKEEIDGKGLGRESILVGTWHRTQHQLAGPVHCRRVLPHRRTWAVSTSSAWWCYMPARLRRRRPLGRLSHRRRVARRCPTATPIPNGSTPDVLVVWGNEPLKSNGDGYLGHWLNVCVQMGTKIISIDPVLTWWGARAEYWLQPRSRHRLLHRARVAQRHHERRPASTTSSSTTGAPTTTSSRSMCQQFTPEWAAVDHRRSRGGHRGSRRACTPTPTAAPSSGASYSMPARRRPCTGPRPSCDLMAICGNIEKPGTHVLVHNSFDINAGYSSVDLYADQQALERKFRKWMVGDQGLDFVGMSNCDAMASVLEAGEVPATGEAYPIKMLWAQSLQRVRWPRGAACRAPYKYMKQDPLHRVRRPVRSRRRWSPSPTSSCRCPCRWSAIRPVPGGRRCAP